MAYRALIATEASNYDKVKEAILSCLGITEETYRRRFREYQLSKGMRPRVAGQYLMDQCTRWLQPEEHTPQELMQKIVIEQFASVLPPGNRELIKRNRPTTIEDAIILAEACEDANEGAVSGPTPAPKLTRTNQPMKPRGGNQTFRPWRLRLTPSWAREKSPNLPVIDSQDRQTPLALPTPVCYRCNEPRHIARNCLMMEVDLAKRSWSAVTAHCKTAQYWTYEEADSGTEIGNLAQDLKIDPADDPHTSFRFMQQPSSSLIRMRETDGLLTIGERIDREHICGQSPECLITFDVGTFSKEKFQLIHVEVEVKDINDNSPQFPHNESYIEMSESAAVGTRFPLDIAVDQDVGPNYIENYYISFNSHFDIEVRSREDGVKLAELVLAKGLDREKEDSYTLQLSAADGGNPAKSGSVTVHIKVLDFNDNSPVFDHSLLKVELYEDAPVGFLLCKLNAVDLDEGINGDIVYGFNDQVSAEIRQVFQIDPSSGRLSLKGLVDYETKKSYELDIQAYDLGLNSVPAVCKVIVDIVDANDNAPEISIKPMTSISAGVAYITESAAEDSFVALVSTSDRDSGANGYVQCSLQGHEHFKLQEAYGDSFMIVTTTTLDREKISEYNLTVIAEDLGSPPFKTIKQYTIRISDENDNAPLFSKPVYEVSVLENNVPGSFITTVVARDRDLGQNAKVTYKLIDAEVYGGVPLSTFVSVDAVSGSIYSVRSFNYELIKQIEMTIQASDEGSPQLSTTALIRVKIVDQNDNVPLIMHPILQNGFADVNLPNNAPPGYLALQIKARDADEGMNAELSYRILQDHQMLFTMNKQTGDIALKNGLTYIAGDSLKVIIEVSDNGRHTLSSTATLNFIVTETSPSDEPIVVILQSRDEEHPQWDISLVFVIMLGGSCVLVLMAIVAVAISCKDNKTGRNYDNKKDLNHRGFETNPFKINSSQKDASIYSGSTLVNGQIARSEDRENSKCLSANEKRGHLETKICMPSSSLNQNPFQSVSSWQEQTRFKLSGIAYTDQMSAKDSGKGDSDFNDSDSETSGDGSRRILTTCTPLQNDTFHSRNVSVPSL
ncbi:protocadherin-8-like [Acipenser ruthenus]|uniref:protocadherin-8-like n=1 Tax=Acipenser ruthenus TaxID=7906 RepID=UPI00274102EE|nr:protocadherin-8-like [Acipenser ruthenus]